MILMPYSERLLNAKDYLKERQIRGDNIAEVQFIPPKIGKIGYGLFRVRYKKPILLKSET